MADSSPKTPAETPTNEQQGLRRSSRSTRGQLSQNAFLLQHFLVGEEAARPIPGPGRRRAIAKPKADGNDETASIQHIGDRRRSASPLQLTSSDMRDRQDPATQQQTMPAFPWEPVFQYGFQMSPQCQNLGQQQIPFFTMSLQPGQMAPPQHFEQQNQESAFDTPGVFVNPADLMLDTQGLMNPQTNNIPKTEVPQFAELVDSYNKIHEERRVQEERDRLAAQEEKDKAKATEAEEPSQEEMDALWDQFMDPDAFK
ncbi:hypothetical protein FPHYL_10879 [Fusarium phyllophilum]|uniref:Uncharacterized protein n=1 Tax=Fusarium phyllophilum TaxID=47803 RepID=A0A8H5IX78_9HYPO|nr:hypothetical protein FPHYL_10879 [Fusarium phyllophilum]